MRMAAPIAHGIRTVGVLGAGQMGPWNSHLALEKPVLTAPHRTRHCVCVSFASQSPGALVGQVSKNCYSFRASKSIPRSKEQVSNSLKFMDKLLAKNVAKGKIQDIEAKEARDRITVLDYDTQGIKGFRDADMVIEVISSSQCTCTVTLITPHRLSRRT